GCRSAVALLNSSLGGRPGPLVVLVCQGAPNREFTGAVSYSGISIRATHRAYAFRPTDRRALGAGGFFVTWAPSRRRRITRHSAPRSTRPVMSSVTTRLLASSKAVAGQGPPLYNRASPAFMRAVMGSPAGMIAQPSGN